MLLKSSTGELRVCSCLPLKGSRQKLKLFSSFKQKTEHEKGDEEKNEISQGVYEKTKHWRKLFPPLLLRANEYGHGIAIKSSLFSSFSLAQKKYEDHTKQRLQQQRTKRAARDIQVDNFDRFLKGAGGSPSSYPRALLLKQGGSSWWKEREKWARGHYGCCYYPI